MRFTTSQKLKFASQVINDIPSNPHGLHVDREVEALLQADAYKTLPKEIKDVLDNPELEYFLNSRYLYLGFTSVSIVCDKDYTPSREVTDAARVIQKRFVEANAFKSALKNEIFREVRDCTTFKAAREKLPYLAAYLHEPGFTVSTSATYSMSGEPEIFKKLKDLGWRGPKAPEVAEATETVPAPVAQ